MSAWLAPVFLIAGFVLGTLAQPDSYRWQWDAISALAWPGARESYWMTWGFVGNGLCHLVTARRLGNPLIFAGGVGVLVVAAFPGDPHGFDVLHNFGAGLALLSLAVWPLYATDERYWATSQIIARMATLTMLSLLAWFATTLFGIPALGLVERVLVVVEALWPLIVLQSLPRDA